MQTKAPLGVLSGDVIPADGILINSSDLNVDESMQTGESDDVIKTVESDIVLHSGRCDRIDNYIEQFVHSQLLINISSQILT